MPSDSSGILRSLSDIQIELRKLIPASRHGDPSLSPSAPEYNQSTGFLMGVGLALAGNLLGCRLLHWDPELADFRSEVIRDGESGSFIVYRPLDIRIGGRPHVFFTRVYKTKYGKPDQPRNTPGIVERQFGITYSGFSSKQEMTAAMDVFKKCAAEAGKIIACIKDRLATRLPVETLAAKDHFHRWIFTVYDVAWAAPPGSPQAATKYIPVEGFDEFMRTDESILYDIDHIRSTPWSEIKRRLDPNRWGYADHLKDPFASWSKELPTYFASRIDDIVQASDWTIEWLLKEVKGEA